MLELHTFGGLELRTGAGERVEALAGRTKCLALLAYVAVEAPEGRVPREEVAGRLWPAGTDERARASLRKALSQIRQATDADLVAGAGTSSVGLARAHVRADVTAFREALEAGKEAEALELYEGDFLAGIHVEGAGRFQRWADRTRGQLRQKAYEAALSVGASARAAGDLASAEEAFRQALDLAPLREEAARELITTLADRGRTADAVQLYEAFRERRRDELEMAPSEELQQQVEELREAPPAASNATGKPAGPGDREPSPEAEGPVSDEFEESPSPASQGRQGRAPIRWGRFRRRTLVGAIVAVGLLSAALAGAWHLLDTDDGTAAAGPGDRSVAVLPFEAIGTEKPGPIAEGLHSDLLTRLSNVSGLEVISATSVERFRNADLELPAIADSLGVKWIVEGDVQRAGDAIQVNAQLIDPRTDTHAWAESYRRKLTAEDLFSLQTEISREIAGVLKTRLTAEEEDRLDRGTTGSLRAHRFYIRGRSLLEQREAPQMRKALAYFDQALAVDSGYALAWAGRANGLSLLARTPDAGPDTLLPRADAAVERALALQPDLAEARLARGRLHMYRREGPTALAEMQRAVEFKPSYAAAHAWLAKLRLSLGRPAEALPAARRSVELDPMSTENLGTLCWALIANGRVGEALQVAERIQELMGGESFPNYEILALAQQRRLEELEAIAREVEEDLPDWARPPFWLAIHRPGVGDTATALEALAHHEGRPTAQMMLHGALGHTDRAFKLLRETYPRSERVWDLGFTIYLRYFWPAGYGPIRADPRFETFLAKMNRHWGLNPDGSLPDSVDVAFSTRRPRSEASARLRCFLHEL